MSFEKTGSFTPLISLWFRRCIGGAHKRSEIWAEYCKARDALIASTAAKWLPSSMKAVVLSRLIADLRSEFRIRYPAWGDTLFFA